MKEVRANFNVARHPDVLRGVRTEQSVLNEFIESFEANHNLENPDTGYVD